MSIDSEEITLASAKERLEEIADELGPTRRLLVKEGKPVAALVSVDDLEFLEQYDEYLAHKRAAEALAEWEERSAGEADESGRTVPTK